MIYPDTFESKLGFDIIRQSVALLCVSPMGAGRCERMSFNSDFSWVSSELGRVDEMLSIVQSSEDVPLGNVVDVRAQLSQLAVEGTFLTVEELVRVRKALVAMAEISSFLGQAQDDAPKYPRLSEIVASMMTFAQSVREIDRVIDKFGNVKDNASEALSEIRTRLRQSAGAVNNVMRKVMAAAVRDGIIDSDASPAVRDGRLVLPVAPMNKRRLSGIVHDESASGKTIFIEPAEVVEINNRIRQLELDERREIVRILTAVSSLLRPHVDQMLRSSEIIGEIDFLHAKALYAKASDCHLPNLSAKPELELYHACHPVLLSSLKKNGKEIVPLDIQLTPENRILLISGPNAGGKSVTLKTVGIVVYMTQTGMLPPVFENSHIGMFEDIFVDIGDDQSIEDDLSTYSSHLRNMKTLVQRGRKTTLVLIDEFGSGTEPQIGGALAQAILEEINRLGVWGVITTHYQNLKHFAEDTAGLINGSMLYDRQLMKPMFRLSIGHPGSSFAIEIARKTGLPREIIDKAQEIVGSDYVNMEKYLLDIQRDRRYWENKRTQIRQKEKKLDQTLQRYNDDAEELRQHRREIIEQARDEAQKIISGSNAAIERTISEIRRTQAEREATLAARRQLQQDKVDISRTEASEHKLLKKAPKKKRQHQSAASVEKPEKPFVEGDTVKLDGEGQPGRIVELKGNQATVVFGMLKTTVNLKRLKHTLSQPSSGANRKASFVSASTSDNMRQRQLNFKQDIDIRGMRVDEAIQAITYFIDDAIQFNVQRVRILHGTGTGALRQSIRQYLDTVNGVRSYRDEHVQFGGAGITVVDLD